MNKAKQLIIAVLCGFPSDHAVFKGAIADKNLAKKLLETNKITKSDIFSTTSTGKSLFEYRETWNNLDAIASHLKNNGENITHKDLLTPIDGGDTPLEMATQCNKLDKAFSPEIWKGKMDELEEAWFDISSYRRREYNLLDIKRKVAKAEGKTLREDVLSKADVNPFALKRAARTGAWDVVSRQLKQAGQKLTVEDLLLSDDSGNHALSTRDAWQHFGDTCKELEKFGEKFTAQDFLKKKGGNDSLLEIATNFNYLNKIFKSDLWKKDPEGIMELYTALDETDREDIEIHKIMGHIIETAFGDKVSVDETLSLDELTRVLNANKKNQSDVRPLGLVSVWDQIDDVKMHLGQRGEAITLDHLRLKSGYADENCLMIAARSGHISDVMSILEESKEKLSVQDLTTKNSEDKTLLDILSDKNQLGEVLRPDHWLGRGQELLSVWEKVPSESRDKLDFQDLIGQINRMSLREKFGGKKGNDKKGPKFG
jgi:hypothetical protein